MESSTPFFPPCNYSNISEGKGFLAKVHINYNEFRPCASHYVVVMTETCTTTTTTSTTTEVDDDRSFEGRCVVDVIKDGEVLWVGTVAHKGHENFEPHDNLETLTTI